MCRMNRRWRLLFVIGGMGLRVAGEHFKEQADFTGPSDVRTWLVAWLPNLKPRPRQWQ